MTGNPTYDTLIIAAVAAVLGALATRLGIPVVWFLERLLEQLKGRPTPPPAPVPAGEELVLIALDAPADGGADGLRTLAGGHRLETVAVPLWLSILLQFVPTLLDLIRRLIGEATAAKGAPLTPAEKTAVAVRVGREYYAGRHRTPEEFSPVEMPQPYDVGNNGQAGANPGDE